LSVAFAVTRDGDGLRLQQDRGHVGTALGVLDGVGGALLLALGQPDGQLGGRVGLLLDRLVDGHALVAGEDVLQALDGRVLAGDRDLAVGVVLLEDGDDRVAEAVVGGKDAVDLAVGLGVHLLEDGAGLLVVPVGHRLVVDLLVLGHLRQHAVVALLEQGGVVVGGRAVQVDDVARRLALLLEALGQALALEGADGHVVERHVVLGAAVEGQPVVVDGGHALGLGLVEHGLAGARVQVDDHQHVGPAGDHLVGDGLELGLVALGVLDVVVDPGGLEGRLEERLVGRLPAGRRLGVGQDDADLGRLAAAAGRGAAAVVVAPATGGQDEGERRHRGDHVEEPSAHDPSFPSRIPPPEDREVPPVRRQ
jgi:hypothetical protein